MDLEIELLNQFLSVSDDWLDVACRTRYFLSQFENVKCDGVDISLGVRRMAKGEMRAVPHGKGKL
jgi:hypothetical protein